MAFLPKLPAQLGLLPRPVVVAALMFTVSFVMINGLQIMTSRLLDARRTVIIALSIIAGMAVEVFPSISASASPALRPVIGSSLVLATVLALALNLLFRLGVKKTATFMVEDSAPDPDDIGAFFQTHGAKWGARPDVIKRATYGTIQLIDAITDGPWRGGPVVVDASFDEFNLDVRVSYDGAQLLFPEERPSLEQILRQATMARNFWPAICFAAMLTGSGRESAAGQSKCCFISFIEVETGTDKPRLLPILLHRPFPPSRTAIHLPPSRHARRHLRSFGHAELRHRGMQIPARSPGHAIRH